MCKFGKKQKVLISVCIVGILVIGVLACINKNRITQSLLIVGDSIGEGAGSSSPDLKWYKKLIPYMKDKYNVNLEITNVSMGGNTSYAGYVRTMNLDAEENYDYVVICYGQNDTVEDFSLYYELLLRTIKEKYPSAILISVLESSQREYTEKMQIIQKLCAHYDVYIADTIAAFNECDWSYEELCDDGTHPNDKGQEVYFEVVAEILDQCYQKSVSSSLEDINALNQGLGEFKKYQYYPVADFEKIEALKYRLKTGAVSGKLGVDYTTVGGDNYIKIYTEDGDAVERRIIWNNQFVLRFIEVVENDFMTEEEIVIEFSSEDMANKFNGIIITGYDISKE